MKKVPTHLSHYPVVGVDGYDKKDGIHVGDTDAVALSVGFAHYNEEHIAAKVFRHTGTKWSRQGEELPLHRTFDLSTLTLKSILMCADIDAPDTEQINPRMIAEQYKSHVTEFYITHREKILPKIKELQQALEHFMSLEEEIK